MVPMRNSSVLLDTIAFTNNPDLLLSYSNSSITPHRVVLNRTPYDIWWFQEFSEAYVHYFNYVSVVQSCRGRFNSTGDYDFFGTAAEDAADTRAWIAAQPWCDGPHIMTAGVSADGITAALEILLPNEDISTGVYEITSGNLHSLADTAGAWKYALFKGWMDG